MAYIDIEEDYNMDEERHNDDMDAMRAHQKQTCDYPEYAKHGCCGPDDLCPWHTACHGYNL